MLRLVYSMKLTVYAASLCAIVILSTVAAQDKFEQKELFRDDFKKCSRKNCMNGGIRTDRWTGVIGDGRDDGINIALAGLWGNNEAQCYYDDSEVLQVVNNPDDASDGILAIRALRNSKQVPCSNKQPGVFSSAQFRSARLSSRRKKYFKYQDAPSDSRNKAIYVEAKIKLPDPGDGLWAAFWMLANSNDTSCGSGGVCNSTYGTWPGSGEIDVMEAVNDMDTISNTIHVAGDAGNTINKNITENQKISRGRWHTYTVEWGDGYLQYHVDGNAVFKVTSAEWKTPFYAGKAAGAPFDKEFYIILNVAVGGNLPGPPSAKTPFPAEMLVDYVRVYYETNNKAAEKAQGPLNGGQIALIVIGGLLVTILALVVVAALWKNVVTLRRAQSFSKVLRPKPTDDDMQDTPMQGR